MRRCLIIACLILFSAVARSEEPTTKAQFTVRLADQIAAALKAGEKTKAWVEVFGKKTECSVSAADGKTLTVLVQGNPFPLPWEKIAALDQLGIAKSFAAGKGDRLLFAAELALAFEMPEQAQELVTQALQADPALAEKALAVAQKLPNAPAIKIPDAPAATAASTGPAAVATANTGTAPGTVQRRSGQARTQRPRLLFTAARLAAVRARVGNADGKRFLSYLKSNPGDGDLQSLALGFVASGDAAFATQAIDEAQKCVSRGAITEVSQFDMLANVAVVYDWCHAQLSEDQRKKWQTWMINGFENLKDAYLVPYHNYAVKGAWAFAMAGYAMQGENPRAAELLDNAYVKRWRGMFLPACKAGLAGGAWAEGEGYGSTTAHALIELAELAFCVEGRDLVPEASEFFMGRLAFEMFLDQPGVDNGGRRLWLNGDMNRERRWDDALQQRLMLQEMLRGTDLAAYAQAYAELPAAPQRQFNSSNWMDVLWRDRAAPQKPLEAFKLSHHAWGRGTVLMRSDWTENATHVGFTAGPLITASHGHADAGHFSIWKEGELATMAGDYRGTKGAWPLDAYKRTVAHNTLLIYDPAEKFTVRHTPALNDGGQLWVDSEDNLNGAKIIAYDARRAYTYVCADLTPAYAKAKAALIRRNLVYVRPDTVVIYDTVVATNPNFPKIWQCYLNGSAASTAKTFTTSNGKAKLRGEMLLPADGKIVLIGGQDKGIKVFEKTIAQPRGDGSDGPAWRAEIHPGAPRASDTFLVVLNSFGGAEPSAASVKDKGGKIAVTVPGGEVIFNSDGAPGGSFNGKAFAQTVVSQEE